MEINVRYPVDICRLLISSGWEKAKFRCGDAESTTGAEELWGQAVVIVGHQAEEAGLDACFSEQVKWELKRKCKSEKKNI